MGEARTHHPTSNVSSSGVVVRALRTLAGLVLVLIGFPSLLAGAAGLLAMHDADDDGGFTTQLAPIHADGYAIVVADVSATMSRFGVSALLGDGGVKVDLRAANAPVMLAIAPRADVTRYLSGVPHTEVTSVGFARGDAPVTAGRIAGDRMPDPPAEQTFWGLTATDSLSWQPGPGQPLSLVLLRADGRPGFDVIMSVSRYPTWIKPATIGLLLAGLAGLIGGIVLLFVAADPVLVVEAHRMVEFADRIADRLEEIAPGESLAVVRRTRGLDLTGELVTVKQDRPWSPPPGRVGEPDPSGRHAAASVVVRSGSTGRASNAPPGRAAGARRRWRGHTPPELADRWAGEQEPSGQTDGDGDDESPYVYTAT